MAKDAKLGIVVTPEFRAAYTNLFEPKAFERNGKPVGDPVYSFTALFPKSTDITALKQKAKAVAVAEWGEGGLAGVRWPFKDGDAEAVRLLQKGEKEGSKGKSEDQVAFLRGQITLKCKSTFPPKVGDNRGEEIIDKSKVYSGIYGRAELNFRATEIDDGGEVKKYVTPYFNFFMKTRDGERLAGRDLKTVFKGLLGGESHEDPTDDMIAPE